MTAPVLGFRGWQMAKPKRHAEPDPDREVFVPMPRPALRHLAADPELDAWLNEHARKARPARRYVTERPDWEPGTLAPMSAAGAQTTWIEPGPVQFLCEAGHQQPVPRCRCGLYAWLSLDQLDHRLAKQDVVGAVIAWGHIVIHGTEGFRAEWMRIVALSPAPPYGTRRAGGKWAQIAANRYGVPCVPLDRLEQVGREFGRPIAWEYRF